MISFFKKVMYSYQQPRKEKNTLLQLDKEIESTVPNPDSKTAINYFLKTELSKLKTM